MNNNIIISAFLPDINKRTDMTIEKYLKYGTPLLQTKIPKIIFTDPSLIQQLRELDIYHLTIFVPFTKYQNYLYNYNNQLVHFSPNTDFKDKDTIDYMFLMCHKSEFMKIALEYIKTESIDNINLIWIDFGIRHIYSGSNEEFIKSIELMSMKEWKTDTIHLPHIWHLDMINGKNKIEQIQWYFAGGIIAGNQKSIIEFSNKVREKCIQIIETYKTITWEVNIWYLIYLNNKELFSPYYGDHNNSMFHNF
jgi:hypothetical protein